MPQPGKPKRYAFMDAANVVACFAVVMLHCSNTASENLGDDYWQWCVIVQSLFIYAVPFFFMISGANLLGYRSRYSTADFFKKRASRILGVFISGTILFYLVECFAPLPFGYVPRTASLSDFIDGFLTNDINGVYWYFYAIIGLYLITPVLTYLTDHPTALRYAIVLSALVTVVFPTLWRFGLWPSGAAFSIPYLGSWLTYYLLGYYLVHNLRRTFHPLLLVAVFCAAVAATVFMTIRTNTAALALSPTAPYDNFYASIYGPFEFFGICALFLLFKQGEGLFSKQKLASAAKQLSALSLGIYAIHMLPLRWIDVAVPALLKSLLLKPIIVFAVSAGVVWLWRFLARSVRKGIGKAKEG